MTTQETAAPAADFAAQLKKGVRVVANCGTVKEPAYYLGTIAKAMPSKGTVQIMFDDGEAAEYRAIKNRGGIVGIGTDKKRKSQIPTASVQSFLANPVSTKVKAPSAAANPAAAAFKAGDIIYLEANGKIDSKQVLKVKGRSGAGDLPGILANRCYVSTLATGTTQTLWNTRPTLLQDSVLKNFKTITLKGLVEAILAGNVTGIKMKAAERTKVEAILKRLNAKEGAPATAPASAKAPAWNVANIVKWLEAAGYTKPKPATLPTLFERKLKNGATIQATVNMSTEVTIKAQGKNGVLEYVVIDFDRLKAHDASLEKVAVPLKSKDDSAQWFRGAGQSALKDMDLRAAAGALAMGWKSGVSTDAKSPKYFILASDDALMGSSKPELAAVARLQKISGVTNVKKSTLRSDSGVIFSFNIDDIDPGFLVNFDEDGVGMVCLEKDAKLLM